MWSTETFSEILSEALSRTARLLPIASSLLSCLRNQQDLAEVMDRQRATHKDYRQEAGRNVDTKDRKIKIPLASTMLRQSPFVILKYESSIFIVIVQIQRDSVRRGTVSANRLRVFTPGVMYVNIKTLPLF